MAMMAPGEGDALLRYSPLFVPDAQAAIEQARSEGLTVSISGVELQTSGSGDRRTLTPESFVVEGTVPSTWGVVMYADPTLPTIVYAIDGRYAVVPAGEQVPATIDELELVTEFPVPSRSRTRRTSCRTERSSRSSSRRASRKDHSRSESSGATVAPISPVPASSSCSRGSARWAAQASTNYSDVDGGHRLCDGPTPFGGSIFSVLFVLGFPTELPSISVVESDGQWYVSPIGTMGASLVERVPIGARRREPDRHAHRPVLLRGHGPPGDGFDARGRVRRSRRSATAVAGGRRRRSRGRDPRSAGQRDPAPACDALFESALRQRSGDVHAGARRRRRRRPRLDGAPRRRRRWRAPAADADRGVRVRQIRTVRSVAHTVSSQIHLSDWLAPVAAAALGRERVGSPNPTVGSAAHTVSSQIATVGVGSHRVWASRRCGGCRLRSRRGCVQ